MRFGQDKYAVLLLKQVHSVMFSGLELPVGNLMREVDVNGCGVLYCAINTEM